MTAPAPLDGLTVIDCATLFAGPLAATILGDFGADVIKVEHPELPDPSRGHGRTVNGIGLWWKMLGRNKRPITLKLSESGRGRALVAAWSRRPTCSSRTSARERSSGGESGPTSCMPRIRAW